MNSHAFHVKIILDDGASETNVEYAYAHLAPKLFPTPKWRDEPLTYATHGLYCPGPDRACETREKSRSDPNL